VARDPRAPWLDEAFSEHCTDTVPAWTGGQSTQQRMIRSGDCKLIYSHGHPVQLFDLAQDPHERRDLAADPQHAALRDRLLARVLDGWDPVQVAARIAERRREKSVLEAWARNVRPDDEFRWTLLPEQNRLDAVNG
jgi:choline-sulfatase